MDKKYFSSPYLRATCMLFLCILMNYFGRQFTASLELPGWFDSYGTFLAAYMYGPIPGALIGISNNVIFAFWGAGAALYSVVSVFIGLSVGYLARKKYFDTFFHTMTVAGAVTVGCAVMSTIINLIFYKGDTNNIWGNGVMDLLMERGMPRYPAALIGEFYIEFPDKLITAIALFVMIKVVRKMRKDRLRKAAKSAAAAAAAVAVFFSLGTHLDTPTVTAQQSTHISYIQTIYNGENGLSCGHANAIAQTHEGVLWIGTYAGLYRYSGSEFVHMNSIDEVRNVNCIYVDNEGRLWVGTNDNGVVIIINEKVSNVINTKNGLPSDSIRSIIQGSTGEYYIGTSGGMVTMEMKIGMTIKSEVEGADNVDHMSADQNGRIAAVNKEGKLFIINGSKVETTLEKGYGDREFSTCAFSQNGTLYAGTTDGAVSRYVLNGNELKLRGSTFCIGANKINNIYPDHDGITWVCSDNGLGYLNSRDLYVRQETGNFDHSIENMLTDYQGNLWFASSRLGLFRLSRSSVKDIYADTGIEPSVVNATAIRNGLLYAGSDDGLKIIDTVARVTIKTELTNMLEGSRVRCMVTDKQNRLWVCSYGAGLICSDRFNVITNYSEKIQGIGTRVRSALELADGSLAVSSDKGIFFIKDGNVFNQIPFDEKTGHTSTLCFLQTPDGTLYAGTDGNGIIVIKGNSVERVIQRGDGLTSEVILRMVFDPDDASIYIVTSNGICRMHEGRIKALKNFPYSNNYDVMLDKNGDILVTGSAGVYVINKKTLLSGESVDYVLINSKTGLIGSLTANAWNGVDSDRNVYLCADRGVFMINLDNYLLKHKAFRLMVSEVRLDEETTPIERGTKFKVDRDTVKIDFVPEIINYSLDDPTVSYMLEGFESDWTNVKQSELGTTIPYTNIKPGEYTFHIAIRDESGKIIEQSLYSFEKQKAIYDNTWFSIYMIVVAGVFVGWLTWFITRKQMDKAFELQQTKLTMALQQVQMGNETILAIAKTVDAKDLRTSKHSQRVSEYSAMIAKEYGFTDEQCENLRKAALLHDIGKIAIPDNVLNKPARLTDEEYAVMKSHVTRGAEILKDFTLIDHVVEGARFHHERYDGRGYPDGLKGDEIPLYGRIIAIADAFDAMTANRVYRQKQDFGYVLDELHKNRGTQFDPELLDIFLKLIDDKKIDIDALYRGEHQKGEE